MRSKLVSVITLAAFVLSQAATVLADTPAPIQREGVVKGEEKAAFDYTVLSETEMKAMWSRNEKDADWKVLMAQVSEKKFARILNREASWGFRGTLVADDGTKQDALLCLFDFIDTTDVSHSCSMVWAKVGSKAYKAYMDFPRGEKDGVKKLSNAQEWYAEGGKVLRAHSFGTRFAACVQRGNALPGVEQEISKDRSILNIGGGQYVVSCPGQCLIGAVACTGLAATVALGTIGIIAASGGTLTIPTILAAGGIGAAMLLGCGGLACGSCFLMCGLAAL